MFCTFNSVQKGVHPLKSECTEREYTPIHVLNENLAFPKTTPPRLLHSSLFSQQPHLLVTLVAL